MLKFWFSKYELLPMPKGETVLGQQVAKSDPKGHHGALIKIQWPGELEGYADLHPWPELGDYDVDTHLLALKSGKISQLVEQTIWLAKKDAVLRKNGKNAFANVNKVKNHYLVSDYTQLTDSMIKDLRSAGFTTLKIKVGRHVEEEVQFIKRLIRQNPVGVRLDFNAKLNLEQYEKFMSQFAIGEKARIEFVEDPIKWNLENWNKARDQGVPLALDFEFNKVDWDKMVNPLPFKVIVIKPARQDVEKSVKIVNKFSLKMVVTSALDHPVGVAHAILVASELKKFYPNTLLDCGCLTLKSYRPDSFSSRIQVQGPYFNSIAGTGIGFDDLLRTIEWQSLT